MDIIHLSAFGDDFDPRLSTLPGVVSNSIAYYSDEDICIISHTLAVSCHLGETDRSSLSLQLARFVPRSLRGHDCWPNICKAVMLA